MTAPNHGGDRKIEFAIPSILLLALGLTIWLTTFTGTRPEPQRLHLTAELAAHAPDEISGVDAAILAVDLTRNAVANSSEEHDGLFAGEPTAVEARYEPLGSASSWIVVIRGPIRSRPNTDEEFQIDDGMIVIELSALTGDISGAFAAGRAFSTSTSPGEGVLRSLGISSMGFLKVPLDLVLR